MSLRNLDDRLVPRLAAMLRSLLDAVSGRGATVRRRAERWLTGGGALRRLDDRVASTGPLKLLRDVPQLGVLVVAAVFLAGTGAALTLRSPENVRVRQAQEQQAGGTLSLGPAVGVQIDPHFREARERVTGLAESDPDGRYLALVSLNKALTPEGVGQLLDDSGMQVQRAYLLAPVEGEAEVIVFQSPGDVVAALQRVFAETAVRKAKEQQDLLETARTIEPATPEEQAFRDLYEADAQTAGEEAAAYRTGCACVFALVVEARASELAVLPALPVVRGVEVAPRGAELPALDVRPLKPTEQGVVEPPGTRPPNDGS